MGAGGGNASGREDFRSFQAGARLMQEAMAGQTDRIPLNAQMHEFVARQLGIGSSEFYTRPEIMVPALLRVQQQYGLPVASLTFDVYNIEAEALGQRLIWDDFSMPDLDRGAPLIKDRGDLARIRTPDFASAGRFARVIEMQALFRELTGLEPALSFCAPFTLAAGLRGIEQLLYDIYTDPGLARSLLERLTEEVLAPWIEHQKRCSPRAGRISGADAIASPPIVNLSILRDWALPYILRLRELCGPGVYVANWVGESCLPDPEAMLDLKLAACPHLIEGQDPDVERLGPAYYRRYAERHGVPLILGIGAGFLAASSPGAVAARVRAYLDGAGPGRLALYLCNLGATTPPANLTAAVQAVRGYQAA